MPVGEKALVCSQGNQGRQGFLVGIAQVFQVEQVVVGREAEVVEVGFDLFAPLGGG